MTIVCLKCADGDPSAVLMVHPSSAVTTPPAPLEITGSTAMTSPGQRSCLFHGIVYLKARSVYYATMTTHAPPPIIPTTRSRIR